MDKFISTPSGTDITKRWKALYNYVPASEQAHVKRKWADFKAQMAKTLDDLEPEIQPAKVFQWQKRSKSLQELYLCL